MNFATWLLPLFFLFFLMLYQNNPESYYENIDEIFEGLHEDFEEKYPTGFDSKNATFQTMIFLFLKAALFSMFAIAVMVVWLASIIPFSAETLLWIYIAFFIIGNIPWGLLLGVGLMVKDKMKKDREKK